MKSITLLLSILTLALFGAPLSAEEFAVMEIRFGKEKQTRTVVIDLYEESAPTTVENFKKLARKGFYNKVAFHRAFPGFMVQTGDPLSRSKDRSRVGTGGPGFTLPAEINRPVKKGSLAMGRLPNVINPAKASNGSQFFIVLEPRPGLSGEYTVFGEVVSGLEVIDEISRKPVDTNNYPVERIIIRRLKIVPASEVPAMEAASASPPNA